MLRVLAAALAALSLSAASASAASLYDGPGPRPGPDLLYAPPPRAPQLENTGPWKAEPIMVSGATAYRSGEFLYQDFLYDDHGANSGLKDPNDERTDDLTFSGVNGTYTYPSDDRYAGNAADLVELRVRPLTDATAFRVTLNTLKDPELVAFTIALGSSAVALPLPDGANATARAQMFLTVHGSKAQLRDALTKAPVAGASVTVDRERRQFDVRVPKAAWNPGSGRQRIAAGVGLWDTANDRYLLPRTSADAKTPGGAGVLPAPAAFFNAAFRSSEDDTVAFNSPATLTDPLFWRDRRQGAALRTGDLGAFSAEVDFGKLAAGTDDDSGVPSSGQFNRIVASNSETRQGVEFGETDCGDSDGCKGELLGQLQPYAIYVPKKAPPAAGHQLTLLLHSLGGNHNQFLGTNNQKQFGERGAGSIVITPLGRGPDGWYYDHAGADTFEVWADVARRYRLDPEATTIGGYSMGGYGTYKFTTQFPDLFARAQPTVGPPGQGVYLPPNDPTPGGKRSLTQRMLPSLRHIPYLIWNGAEDQLVPVPGPLAQVGEFVRLGLRYTFDLFLASDHFAIAINDQFGPAAEFLGNAKVDHNPAHVTYVVNPTMDFAERGTRADHAYWLGALRLRSASGDAPLGSIDARSRAFGTGDPKPSGAQVRSPGTLPPGNAGVFAFSRAEQTLGAVPATPREDVLDVTAANLRSGSVDLARARLSCAATVNVRTDGPLLLDFPGCDRTLQVSGPGVTTSTASLPSAKRCVSRRLLRLRVRRPRGARLDRITVKVTGRPAKTLRGRSLRTTKVDLRGLPRGRFTVKATSRVRAKGKTRTLTETRRYRTCAPKRG